jgi:hypothetical protein
VTADQAAVAAEAALDRGVWTLVVPAKRYGEAVELAREQGYRLPLACTGNGTLTGSSQPPTARRAQAPALLHLACSSCGLRAAWFPDRVHRAGCHAAGG